MCASGLQALQQLRGLDDIRVALGAHGGLSEHLHGFFAPSLNAQQDPQVVQGRGVIGAARKGLSVLGLGAFDLAVQVQRQSFPNEWIELSKASAPLLVKLT